jgi:gamma-glutamyltranspeptidase/glutathione hydrolase
LTAVDWSFPTASRRSPVLADNVVATSQPLAAQAGLRMLLQGGNAVDAALAAAIALTVVEPTMNGIGSDAFAQVWDGTRLHGLNASGRAPAAWTPQRFAGRARMPMRGWDSVTVPGAVSAWVALSERFGRLAFGDLFVPAIEYARQGFNVSPVVAQGWSTVPETFAQYPDMAAFLPGGRPPRAGERFVCPSQADTLQDIASTLGESFYRGTLAKRIIDHARAGGGAMTLEDLDEHRADWVEPLALDVPGSATLHEIPPNGQGIAAQMALGILAHHAIDRHALDSPESLHLQIEAMKLALADTHAHIGDPQHMQHRAEALLSPAYLAARAALVDPAAARDPGHGVPPRGGTVYLCAADASGMMISLIQSNYWGFGSGIVVPGTGISLQNRGWGFSLEPGHPNEVAPRKRPFHTIIPGFLTRDGAPLAAFGVMGGPFQAQGHAQVLLRLLVHGQNPQAAIDAPRWSVESGRIVHVEPGFPEATLARLRTLGHDIRPAESPLGGAQIILRNPSGGFIAASDPRKDGQAVGY